jgi:CSLREA domain-containing protein
VGDASAGSVELRRPGRTPLAVVGAAVAIALVVVVTLKVTGLASAGVTTFVVNSTADAVDANLGDGECATSSGACTLRAAIQEANAGSGANTIELPAGTYTITRVPDAVDPPELPELPNATCSTVDAGAHEGDFDVTCPLTIVGAGAGATIIDGGQPPPGAPPEQTAADRLFDIHQSAGDVTISGLTVREGYHAEAGGAIANASGGTVQLQNIDVRDSYATAYGGGIYTGEPLEVECPEPCAGGAPRLELVGVNLIGNATGGEGGGAFVMFGTLNVTGGSISGNQAANGGGLFNGGELSETGVPSQASLDGVTFEDNVALGAGGAINGDHEGSVSIASSTFTSNTAFDYGGAVAVGSKSSLVIGASTFTGNVSVGEGGAVFTAVERSVSISGSTFTGNEAGKTLPDPEVPGEIAEGEGGGGAVLLGGSGPVTVAGATFTGNSAAHDGGAILIENNASVDITDTVVTGNEAGGNGGGIENAGLRVTFRGLTVTGNEAFADGGGIESQGSGPFTVIDTTIANNTAENGGGFSNAADGTTHFNRVTIWNNRAVVRVNDDAGLGGGIYGLGDAFAEYENVTITGNFAQVRGGGFYADADASISVVSSTISRNVAPTASGVGDEGTDFNFPVIPSLSVLFRNTIVAGNLLSPSCNFALGSQGGNLEDGDSCMFRGSRDRVNADPGLDAVADNGGAVMTMALQPDSMAIDGGVAPCSATDARGVARPQNTACDSGAYEFEGPFPPPDDEPPDTEYLTGPVQATLETSAFTFTGTDNVTPAGELLFECRLLEGDPTEPPEPVDPTEPVDPLDPELMWHGCPSPWEVPLIEEGLYTFEVRAIDRAGNVDPTPDVHIFGGVDDFNPPNTVFTATPPNPSSGTIAAFEFTGNDDVTPPQFLEFECRIDTLDPEAWLECTSPAVFSNLAAGEHTMQVRAADGNDNVDPTPATYTWTVGPPGNCDAANITLFADADAWIDEINPLENFGTAFELEVRSEAVGSDARALVRFGVPTSLPPDCVLRSAVLRLYSEGDAGRTLQALPLADSWAENAVTWNNQPATTGAPTATTSGNGYREWIVTDHVAAMIAGTLPNNGWLVRDAVEEASPGAGQSFTSRHLILEPPETQMPQLILRFDGPSVPTPPAPTPASGTTAVTCGQVITESIVVGNDLFDCPLDGLVIGAPNIDVDLGGHTIDGLNYLLTGEEDGLPAGIRNVSHANVRIHNGTVQEFGQGVQLMAGATFNVVENLTIRANAVAGVELLDADNGNVGNTIRDNLFLGNGESGIWLLLGSENSTIVDNTFDGNAGMAVHLLDAHGHRIEGNLISGVPVDPALDSDGGVLLEGSSDNEIVGNTMAETGDAGVMLTIGSHRNLVQGNVLTRTGDAGVSVSDSDFNEIVGNTAHLGSDAGVVLNAANDGIVRDNDVRFNPTGVDLGGSSDNLIENNDADFSDGTGIAVGSGSLRNEIVGNTASNTAADGIGVEGEAVDALGNTDQSLGNLIEGNTADSNLGSGISVAGVGHTITTNTANSNAGWGIDAAEGNFDGGGNTASGNGEPPQCTGVVCGAGTPSGAPTLDVTPPDTSFLTTPSDPHGMLETVSFTFTGTDDVAPATALHFECRLDPGPDPPPELEPPDLEPPEPGDPEVFEGENWVECANPVTFRLLTTGEHRFEVRAIDPFDNFDLEPAVYEWTVLPMPPGPDSTAPTTTIFEGPSNPSTSTSATFRFGGSDNATEGPSLEYECSLDGAGFAACASPATYTALGLGDHTFEVRAIDLADNADATPAAYAWTIEEPPPDETAPETTIDSAPDPTTVATSATFTFSASEEGVTFECSLDGAGFAGCTSPQAYADLEAGGHTFEVRAVDGAGNADATPSSAAWTIGAAPVEASVSCGQVLTQSTIVTNDLFDCPADGLVIGAHSITLDLNGHLIDGLGEGAGIRNNGFDSVTITGGTVNEFDYGVLLNPGTALNIVDGMTIQLNVLAGVQLFNADNGNVGNTIRDNTVGGNGDGIAISNGSQKSLVYGNTVSGSQLAGVHLLGSSGHRIESNLVAGSAGAGILLEGASGNTISDNTVHASGGDAVAVTLLSNGNRVENNTLTESSNGVWVLDSVSTQILGNDVHLMGGSGIRLENAQNGVVRSNDVRFVSGGIELLRSSGNRIEANNSSETDGAGISLGDVSLNNVVVLNTTNFNSSEGISVTDLATAGSGNLIDRNTASSNVADGINVSNVGHVVVDNVANSNGGWGIYAELGTVAGVNIDGGGNTAVGNGELFQCFGVVCDGSPPLASDTLPPETSILDGPPDPSTSTSATFDFIGFDNATSVTFECRLDSTDAGDFAPCTSPADYTGLSLGEHTFDVRAIDFSGNVDPSPAGHTWTIEAPAPGVPPETTIDSAPDTTTVSTSATFTFSSNEQGATFECSLDGAGFALCSSPATFDGLSVGPHTFEVQAVDSEDLPDPTPATYSWTIGAAPIEASVSCGQVLTQSTLVTNDLLDCPGNGLVVGAHGITIDLGGHTVDGIGQGVGMLNNGFDAVQVVNGNVQEFDVGVQLNPGTASAIVSGLTVQLNQVAGIQLNDADGNTIRGNDLVQNADGIALLGGTQNATVRNNTVTLSSLNGVHLLLSSSNLLEGNTVSGSSEAGLWLQGAVGNTVIGNTVAANSGGGILAEAFTNGTVIGSNGNRIQGNTITGNAGPGVVVTDSNGNELISNTVQQSSGNGIVLELASNNLIRGNDVRFNPGAIVLSDSSNNRLESNNASSGTGAGIELEGLSFDNVVVLNLVIGNDGDGVSVSGVAPDGAGNLVDRNTVSSNGGDGIFVAGGHTVTGNTVNFNDGWGIFAEQGSIDGGGNKAVGNAEPLQCFGVVCEIGVNPGAPDTTLLTFPPNPSNSQSASFTFIGTDDTTPLVDLGFECRLDTTDDLAWVECENPALYTNLAPGEHTFQVRAVDLQENVDPTPATYTWVYEALPSGVSPDTVIEIGPPLASPLLEVFFKFHSTEPDSTFECSLDGGPFEPCANEPEMIEASFFVHTYEFEEFDVGAHTFRVRAIDPEGNADPTPAEYTWTILGLLTTITDGPAFEAPGEPGEPASGGETDSTSATFDFFANIADSTFICSLDLGPFEPCTPPVTYTGLAIGEHIFQVIAEDPEGEFTQIEVTEYEWTVIPSTDATPPQTLITTAPADGSASTLFEFTGTDDQTPPALLSFECRLDSTLDADWFGCESPFDLLVELPEFAPGSHTFEVRAIDDAEPLDPNAPFEGNVDPTPAVHTWTSAADTIAPDTEIVSGPPAQTIEPDVEFTFSGTDNATSELLLVFECSVGGAPFEECESPYQVQGQLPGTHELQVRAVDIALNADPTPATYEWTVIGPPVTTFLTGPPVPPATTTDTTAEFTFEADQTGSTFECALNGSAFVPCESPLAIPGLGGGGYELAVQATNTFGLVEDTPALYEWTIEGPADTSPPDTEILTSPPATGAPTMATFAFTASELGSSFQCQLDGLGFTSCESPVEYTELAGGPHTFEVRAVDLAGNADPTPATYTWSVLGAPVTTITAGPDSPTESSEATFEFTSSVPGATFFCAVDLPPFEACTSPVIYTGLTVGEHTFVVYSTADGFVDSEGDDWEWEVVAPVAFETTLTSAPPTETTSTGATFAFTSSIEGSTFECSLDGAPFASCVSPVELAGLPVGEHTFEVRAVDPASTVDPTPATYTWTVLALDTTPPNTTVAGPDSPTVSTDAALVFAATELGSSFECSLDGAVFEECVSPVLLNDLELGTHTFQVRATDAAGNTDPTPAEHVWTVEADTTPPETTITQGPSGSIGSTAVQLDFTGTDNGTPVLELEFECSLNGEPFSGCSSPVVLEDLAIGGHTFEVRAIDLALNVDPTPATRSWSIVDVTPPDTSIDSGPADPTEATTATFTFSADEAGSTFECSLDGAAFAACVSAAELTGLTVGPHSFRVRAVDPAGNTDPTPDLYEWTVVAPPPPDTSITAGPPAATELTEAAFIFASDPPVLDYECSLDGVPFAECESPHEEQGVSVGEHELQVRAVDAAGNADPTPAAYTWTVLAPTPPDTTIGTAPPATTEVTTATFTFTANEPVEEFECSLDGAPFASCEPPVELQGLAFGEHTFEVRAIDLAGNVDSSPASHTWTVEQPVPPPAECGTTTTYAADADAWIDQASSSDNKGTDSVLKVMSKGSSSNLRALVRFALPAAIPTGCIVESATLRLFAASSASGRTLQALRVTAPWTENGVTWSNQPATNGTAATTTSGSGYRQWNVTSQVQALYAAGANHGFLIRDATENQDAEQQLHSREKGESMPQLVLTFAPAPPPDTAPPDTEIESGTYGSPTDPTATFEFSATEEDSTFECSLDGTAFETCTTPVEYSYLEPGEHTFEVRAIDPAGNVDPSPASYEWTVEEPPPDTTAPETTIGEEPAGTTSSTSATFTFSADEAGSTFECSLDGAEFTDCSSPRELTGLAVGGHEFRVRATDPAGNVDDSPATYSWTIEQACDAATVTVGSNADSWVLQSSASSNYGSDSVVKVDSKSGSNARALFRFALPTLPAGCQVVDATLRLYAGSHKNGRTLQALQVAAAWNESSVTWSNQPATTGSAATTSSGSGWRQWTVTSQVQSMITGANHGFLIRDASENGSGREQAFHSREKAPDRPPELIISFG